MDSVGEVFKRARKRVDERVILTCYEALTAFATRVHMDSTPRYQVTNAVHQPARYRSRLCCACIGARTQQSRER